jgi:hypothetical protein
MTILLVIDPGETTGVAVFELTATEHELVQLYSATWEMFRQLVGYYEPEFVVIEGMPEHGSVLQRTKLHRLYELFPNATWISPGAWKPIAKAQAWKVPMAETPHERDAYNLARFWAMKTGRQDFQTDPEQSDG